MDFPALPTTAHAPTSRRSPARSARPRCTRSAAEPVRPPGRARPMPTTYGASPLTSPGSRRLGARGIAVTAPGDRPGIDCVSRFFAPGVGVAEDPVTGSAHCMLAPFWADRLGRTELVGEQASARGGIVRMRLSRRRPRPPRRPGRHRLEGPTPNPGGEHVEDRDERVPPVVSGHVTPQLPHLEPPSRARPPSRRPHRARRLP